MRKRGKITKAFLFIIVVGVVSVLFYNNFETKKSLVIENWDNVYDEQNIKLFYEDKSDIKASESLNKLNNIYKVSELSSQGKSEIEKVLRTVDILNSIVEYDDVADSNITDGYEILKKKDGSKKVTGREMAIIERDLLICAGFNARVGEFRKENPQLISNSSYYVVEYFSEKYNKWVVVDFRNRAYYMKGTKPVSAIELLSSNLDNLKYNGKNKYDDIKGEFKKYLSSYTISIDNTLNMKRSNSYLTYISSEKDIDLMKGNEYILPTIFTSKKELFLEAPNVEKNSTDKKTYLILMKSEDNDKGLNYIIAAFKDSSVINNYYLRINNGKWIQVTDVYYNHKFQLGKNKIELSLDGKETISEIEINREK